MTPPGRPSATPPPRSSQPATPSRDTKSSLYEAALAAVQDRATLAKARAARRPRQRRRFPLIRVLLVVAMVEIALLVLRPSWIAGPGAPPPESTAVAAASLRLTLLHQRGLVLEYIRRTGRPPATLAEAGSRAQGIGYQRSGDAFALSGHAGDSMIVLRSTDSVATFLGESLARLKNRGRP